MDGWMDGWVGGWADGWMDGQMDGFQIYVFFNSISVVSGQWADDNERLCAVELHLQLKRSPLTWGSNPVPLDQ